ncbi:MAG: peptidoglycan DD-metalloendopeptidase family protein [Alphaproteobacteria bacterium]
MRHFPAPIEFSRVCNLTVLGLIAGLFAGCSADVARLTDPIYTGSTTNQQHIIGGQPSGNLNPYPQASVQSSQLPPANLSGNGQYAAAPAYQAAPNQQAAYQPPKPYAAAGMTAPVGTLQQAPTAPLRMASVQPSANVVAGRAPRSLNQQAATIRTPAPVKARAVAAAPAPTAPAGGRYKVRSGDTLYSIARRHGVSTNQLMAANSMSGSSIRSGQSLTIPGGSAIAAPTAIAKASVNRQPAPTKLAMIRPAPKKAAAAPAPVTYTPPRRLEAPVAPSKQQQTAQAPKKKATGFRWPVRGRIISDYGKKPNGERNDGINIAVPAGVGVKAADDGIVIYSGNELKSYGNLVLVKHADGWVTAYGHNSKNLVKRGDTIRRGQVIAETGMSGGAKTPQLHFEVRKGANPVNPLKHMADA